jgi:PAS domain S-box-containing protein
MRACGPEPELLQRLWHVAPSMMGAGSYEGYLLVINPAFRELMGWSADEIRSVPYWELVHPDDRPGAAEARQCLVDDGAMHGHELRLLRRDGTYRWTRWDGVRVEDDQLLYLVGMDISDRRPPEPQRETVATWRWDLASDMINGSAAFHELFGLPADTPLASEHVLECVHAEDRLLVKDAMRLALNNGEQYAADYRVPRDGRPPRWVHVSGRVVTFAGDRPRRVAGIAIGGKAPATGPHPAPGGGRTGPGQVPVRSVPRQPTFGPCA